MDGWLADAAVGLVCVRLYVEKLQQYMQRVWTNKNSKVSGLTFEEALIGEQSHASVQCVGQVGEEL